MSQRVARHPQALYSKPRKCARKRRCDGHLTSPHMIEVGDLAVWSALPPNSDVGNTNWWHAVFCSDCAPEETVQHG